MIDSDDLLARQMVYILENHSLEIKPISPKSIKGICSCGWERKTKNHTAAESLSIIFREYNSQHIRLLDYRK